MRILHLQKENPDWKEISKLLKKINIDKTPLQLYQKWHSKIKKKESEIFKFPFKKIEERWTITEEREFLRIINLQKEYTDWDVISNLLKELNINKSTLQC